MVALWHRPWIPTTFDQKNYGRFQWSSWSYRLACSCPLSLFTLLTSSTISLRMPDAAATIDRSMLVKKEFFTHLWAWGGPDSMQVCDNWIQLKHFKVEQKNTSEVRQCIFVSMAQILDSFRLSLWPASFPSVLLLGQLPCDMKFDMATSNFKWTCWSHYRLVK